MYVYLRSVHSVYNMHLLAEQKKLILECVCIAAGAMGLIQIDM